MTRRALHLAMAIVGLAAAPHAQQASPAFEVASVKRNLAGDPRVGGPTALGRNTPNGVSYTNYTLPMLIRTAYGIREDWISGGPEWVRTARFDVVARAGSEVSREELYMMLRTLLGERFKLIVSRQRRERDAYVLRLNRADGRLGPDLRKAPDDCEAKRPSDPLEQVRQLLRPSSGALPSAGASCATMESVAAAFERTVNAMIIDETGLTGRWDFVISHAGLASGMMRGRNGEQEERPSIFVAAQEQLGLKLERRREPEIYEVLLIDSVERPAPE